MGIEIPTSIPMLHSCQKCKDENRAQSRGHEEEWCRFRRSAPQEPQNKNHSSLIVNPELLYILLGKLNKLQPLQQPAKKRWKMRTTTIKKSRCTTTRMKDGKRWANNKDKSVLRRFYRTQGTAARSKPQSRNNQQNKTTDEPMYQTINKNGMMALDSLSVNIRGLANPAKLLEIWEKR